MYKFETAVYVEGSRSVSTKRNQGYIALYKTHYSLEPLKSENTFRARCRMRAHCKLKIQGGKTSQGRCVRVGHKINWIIKPNDCECEYQT